MRIVSQSNRQRSIVRKKSERENKKKIKINRRMLEKKEKDEERGRERGRKTYLWIFHFRRAKVKLCFWLHSWQPRWERRFPNFFPHIRWSCSSWVPRLFSRDNSYACGICPARVPTKQRKKKPTITITGDKRKTNGKEKKSHTTMRTVLALCNPQRTWVANSIQWGHQWNINLNTPHVIIIMNQVKK